MYAHREATEAGAFKTNAKIPEALDTASAKLESEMQSVTEHNLGDNRCMASSSTSSALALWSSNRIPRWRGLRKRRSGWTSIDLANRTVASRTSSGPRSHQERAIRARFCAGNRPR